MSDAVNQIVEQSVSPVPSQPVDDKSLGGVGTDAASPALKQEEKVSGRLEMLIRREQQAIARERIAKAAESESLRLRQELDQDRSKISEFNSVKSNPKLALEKLGLTYDELTKAMLADGELPPEVEIKKLRGDIDGLRQDREKEKRSQAEQAKLHAQAQEQRATEDFKSEISNYVKENAARYELINFDEREDEVYELIDAHYTRTQLAHQKELEANGEDPGKAVGKIMKIAEAADKIEEYYEKKEQEKKKLAKLQAIWGAVPKQTLMKEVEKTLENQRSRPTRTLTNSLNATPSKPTPRPVSEDQRVAKILQEWRASRGG